MKKLVISLAAAALIFGIAATTVSAEKYDVKQGDTLGKVAKQYHTTIDDIVNINNLNDTTIHPDQILNVPAKSETSNDSTYTVKEGDTLSKIAVEFDVSVNDIKKWNDLSSDLIVVGQELELNEPDNGQDVAYEPEQTNEMPEMDNNKKRKSCGNIGNKR